jgi:hypothetical protein
VLWHNPFDRSTERFRLIEEDGVVVLEGLVLAPADGEPARVEYRVEADAGWSTRRARLRIDAATWTRAIELERDGERWRVDGGHDPALDGCTDVDLRITPATNTLPIRRLALEVGERGRIACAWVGFPGLEVARSEQLYERLGDDAYRYSSNGFAADLRVAGSGVVLAYGDAYWRAIATA